MPSRLDDELHRLVSAGILRPYQAEALRAAADADASRPMSQASWRGDQPGRGDATAGARAAGERSADEAGAAGTGRREAGQASDAAGLSRERGRDAAAEAGAPRSALVEVLGYIGGVLLLGAVALLTLANWGEMGRAARTSTGVSAATVLLGSAVVLQVLKRQARLSAALASLGCCVAGFATAVAIEGVAGRVTGVGVALALAILGLWWLAGSSLLVAMFGILSVGVLVLTADVLTTGDSPNSAGIAGTAFILVAFVLGLIGLVRDQTTAWALAGAAMFSSSICWLIQERGEVMALAVGSAGPAALLVAYGRHRASAYAVVGCAILLVIWPTALYQLTDDVVGVAIGLGVASAALLVAVVLLARRNKKLT